MLTNRPLKPLKSRLYDIEERLKFMLGRGAQLTFEQIHAIACQATGGLTDGGDAYYEEPLRALLDSARHDDVSLGGRRMINDAAWSALARRFQLVDARKRQPQRFSGTVVKPPFLVTGMARTGTTLLHRLLAVDPDRYGLPKWELYEPFAPADGPDERRQQAWERYENRRSSLDHIHFSDPGSPEECSVLTLGTFVSGLFWAMAPMYGYIDWARDRGHELDVQVYGDYVDLLRYLQGEHPTAAFALKSPSHVASLGALSDLLPDAMLVHTVRDPLSWLNSGNSLVYQHHRLTSSKMDVERMSETNTALMERSWERHLEQRTDLGSKIIDVYYDDLMERPIEVVRAVYDFHEVAWPDGHEGTLRRYLDEHPRSLHGSHTYSSEDFGLTDGEVLNRFASYTDVFGLRGAARDSSVVAA